MLGAISGVIGLFIGNYGCYLVPVYNYKHLMFVGALIYAHSLMGYCLSVVYCVCLCLLVRGVACSIKRQCAPGLLLRIKRERFKRSV